MNIDMIILNILEFCKVSACFWMAFQLKRIADGIEAANKKQGEYDNYNFDFS